MARPDKPKVHGQHHFKVVRDHQQGKQNHGFIRTCMHKVQVHVYVCIHVHNLICIYACVYTCMSNLCISQYKHTIGTPAEVGMHGYTLYVNKTYNTCVYCTKHFYTFVHTCV